MADELLSSIFKTAFIALSLIAMLACIIAIALPLTSMRIFNSMGMSERAIDFGERYIARELDAHKSADGKRTAAYEDANGNMPVLSATPALTNADFIEALYVCNRLSDKLLTESLRSGDNARAEYYAVRLEKYTRMYLSLNGLSAVTIKTNADNIASMPSPALRPVVYSYEHDMRVKNYRARAVLGKTGYMATAMSSSGAMITLSQFSETMYGTETSANITQLLDNYIDYIDQLGAYLDVEFTRIGVETDLDKKFTVTFNGREITASLQSEIVVRAMYGNNILNGGEFSLFVVPPRDATSTSNGYTRLFNQLVKFTQYAQLAVDTLPVGDDGELHRLYWLRVLSSVSKKLNYMEMLLYYNCERLGINGTAIRDAYPTCDKYLMVDYTDPGMPGVNRYQISEVYRLKLREYMRQYES